MGRGIAAGQALLRFSSSVLDIVFPGRCVLCGQVAAFGSRPFWSVCERCVSGLSVIQGRRCTVCSTALLSESALCTRCRDVEYAFLSSFSVFEYREDIKELIYQYKFRGRRRVALLFAHFLADAYERMYSGVSIVPVPARPVSVRKRGWDHVGVIASILGNRLSVPVIRCLERTGGSPQKSLDFHERRRNLRGKIRLKRRHGLLPRHAVLLDDVFTTGATVDECARVLVGAGAGKVNVLTVARD